MLRYEMLLPAFAVVLARITGLMLSVPMFSSTQIPRLVKVWLAVSLALLTFPVVLPQLPATLSLGQAVDFRVKLTEGRFRIVEIDIRDE